MASARCWSGSISATDGLEASLPSLSAVENTRCQLAKDGWVAATLHRRIMGRLYEGWRGTSPSVLCTVPCPGDTHLLASWWVVRCNLSYSWFLLHASRSHMPTFPSCSAAALPRQAAWWSSRWRVLPTSILRSMLPCWQFLWCWFWWCRCCWGWGSTQWFFDACSGGSCRVGSWCWVFLSGIECCHFPADTVRGALLK